MSHLNESKKTIVRTTWDRANRIRIVDEYNKKPLLTFEVQTIILDDDVVAGTAPKSMLTAHLDSPKTYPLYNAKDDSIISDNGASHDLLYNQIYSLFKFMTKKGV